MNALVVWSVTRLGWTMRISFTGVVRFPFVNAPSFDWMLSSSRFLLLLCGTLPSFSFSLADASLSCGDCNRL